MARAKTRKTKPSQVKPATPVRTERQRFEDFLKGFTFKWECVFNRQGRVIAEEDPVASPNTESTKAHIQILPPIKSGT